ncbi:MAG: radical SAM family heme chaperone HemW [Bacteroidia bacterium]|nr:radical SAM family heme chaperone HemW [Bacteroidia bacterium]
MAGLYLHIPYCRKACSYCDFYFLTGRSTQAAFVAALQTELRLRAGTLPTPLETVYYGGGTPSLLVPAELEALQTAVATLYGTAPSAEVTLEANPDDVTPGRAQAWRALGITRVSLGVQSFHDDELRQMGRAHSADEARRSIGALQAAGFERLSLDLIYHLPGSTPARWGHSLAEALALGVGHLSCYALTVEPRTALAHQVANGRVALPDEAAYTEQYLALVAATQAAGYTHYEVSSFAQPGHESRHNWAYWQGAPYLGLGPAAHSFDGHRTRRWNAPNLHAYLEALAENRLPPHETEVLTAAQRFNEVLVTGLRTQDGFSLPQAQTAFPELDLMRWAERHTAYLVKLVAEGLVARPLPQLGLTDRGLLHADGIAARLALG